MNPETLLLFALSGEPTVQPQDQDPLVELAEQFGMNATSVVTPGIEQENCSVDLGEYPDVNLMWPYNGPTVDPKQETILVGERDDETGELVHSGLVEDFETEKQISHRTIDLVLAVDNSGSMDDNENLTRQIIKQVERHYPNARVNTQIIYYNEGGVVRTNQGGLGGYGYNSYLSRGLEEDHVGAITTALRILKEDAVAGSKRHVFVLTDEADKRSKKAERDAAVRSARAQGVQVHLIYDGPAKKSKQTPATPGSRSPYGGGLSRSFTPWTSEKNEDFTSLISLARSTGGQALRMAQGTVPNIFRTEIATEEYTYMSVTPLDAYQPGEREFVLANGEGARCVVDIPISVIENAILEGKLPEPPNHETPEAETSFSFNLPNITPRDGLIAIVSGLVGFFAGRRSQKK